jgi:hypothetical protein
MLTEQDFIVVLNSQKYYFKITISNGDKTISPIELTYYMVEELQIEETLFNWVSTASLVIKNDYELLERGYIDPKKKQISKSPFIFRHDGRNKVNIRIFPLISEEGIFKSITPELNEINYDFVIYGVEDLTSKDQSKKRKKLLLWDERYQHFLERNIQWSTYYVAAEIAKTTDTLPDISCKVGLAIKHLIQTACGESKVPSAEGSAPLKVGWTSGGPQSVLQQENINFPSLKVASFDPTKWDEGSEDNMITYTSPATYSVVDDLEYLLKYYISSIDLTEKTGLGMPGLLRLHRYNKTWSLIGLDQIYAKCVKNNNQAGDDVIEKIEIQVQDDVNVFGTLKAPTFTGSSDNFTSKILSYKFVNLKNLDDLSLCNRPSINYDNKKCLWNIYFEKNTVEGVVDSLKKNFITKTFSSKTTPGVLINNTKDKRTGFMTSPEHVVVQGATASVLPRNSMISASIFLNQALEFNSLGATTRTPGKFVNIERSNNNNVDNDFENKFIGQWLLVRVVHTFFGDKYLNNTTGVKFNSFNELSIFNPDNDIFNE